jgi:type I restriction enzyme S subunit
MSKEKSIVPELRFPEFEEGNETWKYVYGDKLFKAISNKDHNSDLPVLAITQDYGAIPRELIDYTVIASKKSISSYKVVNKGDFIISLRSFQGGIEYSNYHGICSPAYIVLRRKVRLEDLFYKFYLKTSLYIRHLNKNLEGIRDGKMISYKQFSQILLPYPSIEEQQKIADCLSSLDALIAAHRDKLDALREHKKGLMQNLFPQEGERVPRYRFAGFEGAWEETTLGEVSTYFKGYAFKSKDYTSEGVRIVRVSDMGFDSIKKEGDFKYIQFRQARQYSKWKLHEGDLIVTTVGSKPPIYDSLVGRTIVVRKKDKGSLLNQNAVCIRAEKDVCQPFLNAIFKKGEYITFIESIIRGNANQGSITLKSLFEFSFLVPSIEEQQKIADCLSAADELITAQEDRIAQLQEHKRGLMQGLFPKTNG